VYTVLVTGVIERNAEQKEIAEGEWSDRVDTTASTEDREHESIVSDHQSKRVYTLACVKCTRNGTCDSHCQSGKPDETEK
jgi:hypothetical protein